MAILLVNFERTFLYIGQINRPDKDNYVVYWLVRFHKTPSWLYSIAIYMHVERWRRQLISLHDENEECKISGEKRQNPMVEASFLSTFLRFNISVA